MPLARRCVATGVLLVLATVGLGGVDAWTTAAPRRSAAPIAGTARRCIDTTPLPSLATPIEADPAGHNAAVVPPSAASLAGVEVGKTDAPDVPPPVAPTPTRSRARTAVVLAILLLLIFQNAGCAALTAHTRANFVYSGAAVALAAEGIKVPAVLASRALFGKGEKDRLGPVLREAFSWKALPLAVPAACYAAQNVLYYVALSNLDVTTYQVLAQSKTATTALFFTTLFGKTLRPIQWAAISLLMAGMALVQICNAQAVAAGAAVSPGNPWVGAAAVFTISMCSGFANVSFEKLIKSEQGSMFAKQLQLGMWTTFYLCLEVARRGEALSFSFPALVWGVAVLKSLGGLLVAATIKHTDNIVKSYAVAMSILVTCVGSALVSRAVPSASFLAGVVMVLASIFLYSTPARQAPQHPEQPQPQVPHSPVQPPFTHTHTHSLAHSAVPGQGPPIAVPLPLPQQWHRVHAALTAATSQARRRHHEQADGSKITLGGGLSLT